MTIGDYTALVKLILSESAKYFGLLLLAVLAVRLWRRVTVVSGRNRGSTVVSAFIFTAAAVVVGCFSMCHSLGLLYTHYAMRAFNDGNFASAHTLFGSSFSYWKNADAVGGQGLCLLLSGQDEPGLQTLEQARTMRGGKNSQFEEFYLGIHYFFDGHPEKAMPLLSDASRDPAYQWDSLKLLGIMLVEDNQPAEAARLIQMYRQAEIRDVDQAYLMASLDVAEGKKPEALEILKKFPTAALAPFWKARFEKLQQRAEH
jgi:hypothetical protein